MRIENLLLNNINLNNSDNILKEGSLFKGEILEIFEEFILIDIIGQGIIKATSESDIDLIVGNELNFLIKSNENGKMKIKPLINEELGTRKSVDMADRSIAKILSQFNIPEDKLSIDLVENLMKYNVPINEKNILEGIKAFEKLIELSSLEIDDKVVVFENKNVDENKTVSKGELIYKKDPGLVKDLSNKDMIEDIKVPEDLKAPDKINIKNLLVVDKNSYPEKEDSSNLIKEILDTEVKIDNKEFNKIFSFFIKNDIEPSLNNIKNLSELVKDPMEFSKDFLKLNLLLKEFVKDEGIKFNFNKLKDPNLNVELKKEDIKEAKQNIRLLQNIVEKTDSKTALGSNIKKEINELENKLDFLKEMDRNLSFLFLPINYGKKELDGVLTLLKDNKKKKSMDEKINIFINLDTNNLGNIKISCLAKQEILSIKINIQESDLKLFQKAEQGLIDRIESIGYTTNKIEFLVDEDLNVMDTITTNTNPNYFLDIKV